MRDLIDRQALLEQYGGNLLTAQTDYAQGFRDIIEDIKNAPTVEERKHGQWIKTDWGDYKCSVCGNYEETTYAGKNKIYKDFSDFQSRNNFCRNCGSFMEEVTE